jgi:hypothetical protein
MENSFDFLVRRDDIGTTEVRTGPPETEIAIADGQVLLAIDTFSVTANNVTYGAMGEAMKYFEFFPAEEGWGRVPAWGYADVVRSKAEGVEAGARVFGFFPMASHVVFQPGRVSNSGFVDETEHRAGLPAIYNRYGFASTESGDTPEREPFIALFAPLFTTAWLAMDWLDEEGFFGAARLLVSSASSKTALSLAYLIQRDHSEQVELVGLTSPGNVEFTEATGYYDRVLSYDDLESLEVVAHSAYLDFSGNAGLRERIHNHLGDTLLSSTVVGAADWEHLTPPGGNAELPGPTPELFFAPTRIAKRNEDWGAADVRGRVAADQNRFIDSSAAWLSIRSASGPEGIAATWQAMIAGEVDPSEGWTVSPSR